MYHIIIYELLILIKHKRHYFMFHIIIYELMKLIKLNYQKFDFQFKVNLVC